MKEPQGEELLHRPESGAHMDYCLVLYNATV